MGSAYSRRSFGEWTGTDSDDDRGDAGRVDGPTRVYIDAEGRQRRRGSVDAESVHDEEGRWGKHAERWWENTRWVAKEKVNIKIWTLYIRTKKV